MDVCLWLGPRNVFKNIPDFIPMLSIPFPKLMEMLWTRKFQILAFLISL